MVEKKLTVPDSGGAEDDADFHPIHGVPGFEGRRLGFQVRGWFATVELVLDGEPVPMEGLVAKLPGAAGEAVDLKVVPRFPDPIPKVSLAGEVLDPAPSPNPLLMVWAGLPVLLMFVGGALGGGLGAAGGALNVRVLRSHHPLAVRLVACGFVTLATVMTFFVSVTLLHLALGG